MFVFALKRMKWVYVRVLGQLVISKAALKARRLPHSATPPTCQPWNQEEEDVDHAKKESLKRTFFAAFTWNSRERFWHGNFPLFSRPFIGGYQNFTVPPSPSHVCCQNWRKIQTCPLCCSASLMPFSYLWAAAVSSPPPMQRPPMKTRGTDDAPVSWRKKG